jgi:hypothetical protein
MMIRCPKCDRMGYLPDNLATEARSLRCRKCKANFLATELAVKDVKQHRVDNSWRSGGMDTPGAGPSRQRSAPFRAEDVFGRFDDPSRPLRTLGPGDSNYEMTVPHDESGADWEQDDEDTFEPEAASSDEIEAVLPGASGAKTPYALFSAFMATWGRTLVFGVLGYVAFSTLVIGVLVASSLGLAGIRGIPASSQALILASLGAIALLLIGAAMILQLVFLAELVRDVRRLNEPEDRLSGR